MAALDTFLARVMPRAMGCEEPLARQAIIDAAIEFCEDTSVVQEVIDPFTATINVPSYTLTLPAETAVAQIMKAWFKTVPLGPAANELIGNVLAYHSVSGNTRPTGQPSEFFWFEEQMWVFPTPDVTSTLSLSCRVAIKPSDTATTVPDELMRNWREAIVSGALERILGARGTVHYDPQEASKHGMIFRDFKARARMRAVTGRGSGELMARMRPMA